jgi:nitrogen fixation/metabolism regulation signal transduction histidine kinase
MSDAPAVAASGAGRAQRSAKNLLLDRNFQLKYAGLLVGIAVVLSGALGVLLWSTSSEAIDQSRKAVEQGRETVRQGQETVARGQQVLVQSRKVSQVVAMNIAKEYKDDPELAKTFAEAAARDDGTLVDEQKRLEADAASLAKRAAALEAGAAQVADQQRRLLVGLVAGFALLVVALGAVGIVFTHKVAGPIHKMKRLLREVGEGKLVVRERLRKGDELLHFFEAFEAMVDALRARQRAEIAQLDVILAKLDAAPVSSRGTKEMEVDGITMLRRVRQEMQDQIEA